MALKKVSAKVADGANVVVEYDFGDNLQDAVDRFGEEVIFSRFVASAVISLQSLMRSYIKKGKEDELDALVEQWKPGVSLRQKADPVEKASKILAGLSDEERQALIEKFLD